VTAADYAASGNFVRLKALGFENRHGLYTLMAELEGAVLLHGDRIDAAVAAAQHSPLPDGFRADADRLRAAARAWMDDVHDYCVATRYLDRLDVDRVRFNRAIRAFRREHPWLVNDLGVGDVFDYVHPTDGSVVFHGMRRGPEGDQVLFIANMEGRPVDVLAADLPGAAGTEWSPALVAPGVDQPAADAPMRLADAQGVVFVAG
jgi:hypothetical protein